MDFRGVIQEQLENRRIFTMKHYGLQDLYKEAIVENDYDSLVIFYDRLTNLAKDLQQYCLINPYSSSKIFPDTVEDENCIHATYIEQLSVHDQLYEVYMTIDTVQGMLYRAIRFNN